jgi:hypothetical protein
VAHHAAGGAFGKKNLKERLKNCLSTAETSLIFQLTTFAGRFHAADLPPPLPLPTLGIEVPSFTNSDKPCLIGISFGDGSGKSRSQPPYQYGIKTVRYGSPEHPGCKAPCRETARLIKAPSAAGKVR